MTVTFRNNIGSYIGVGRRLTISELDGNFYDLLIRMIAVEAETFGCSSIDYVEGGYIKFNWSDGSSSGPFPLALPMPRGRGVWTNSMQLSRLDIVSVTDLGYFLVLNDHETPATGDFDPAALDGTGSDSLYQQISPPIDLADLMRYRGDFDDNYEYEVDDVFTDATYGTFIVLVNHTSAATFDPYATNGVGGARLYRRLAGPAFTPVVETTPDSGSSYNVSKTDVGKYLRFTEDVDIIFSSDIDDLVAGDEIHFRRAGTGVMTFSQNDTTVLVNPQRQGYDTAAPYQGATVTAKYLGDDAWDLIGPHGDAL